MRNPISTTIAALWAAHAIAQPLPAMPTPLERVGAALSAQWTEFVDLRHDLHRHPEPSGSEVRTARVVAERMKALGLDVRTGVGGHGVVAILKGGRPGPVVAYRADMDAISSADPDPVDFPSTVPGVRHQCGHDMHTAIAVALATAFSSVRAEVPGSIMFIFQPAEERAAGARAMLADGIFSSIKPAAIYGLHTGPGEVGRMGTRQGVMMAARDRVSVTLSGSGDKQAADAAVRAVLMSASTITAAQALQPGAPDFSFVQVAPSRTDNNGITIEASVTLASESARDRVRQELAKRLADIGTADVALRYEYQPRYVAGVTNDPALTTAAVSALKTAGDSVAVQQIPNIVPAFSEDFGAFQHEVPGVFFFLGVSNAKKGYVGMPHSPNYAADDAAILVGSRAMAVVLLDRLGRP